MEQDEFPIRAYGRTELAVCYFPHLNYMPVQVRMIVEAIGEP